MKKVRLLCGAAALLAIAGAGQAQTPPVEAGQDAAVDVIVVTAQKREQRIRDVPLSIVAVPAADLEARNINSALDLGRAVPNFYAARGAAASNTRFVVRGIGTAGNTAVDPSTAFFLDGVYIPRPSVLYSSFLDIASVEVVRGPQGTLFGRNTTAGGVILNTTPPGDEVAAEGYVEFGEHGRQRAEAVLNMPAGTQARFRLAAQASELDGYGSFIPDGRDFGFEETVTLRASGAFDITDRLSWTVRLDHTRLSGDGRSAAEADGSTLTAQGLARLTAAVGGASNLPELEDPYDFRVNHIVGGDLSDVQWGGSSDLSYAFDNGFTLSLISGWRDYDNRQTDEDIFLLSRPLVGRTSGIESESWSHELRLVSPETLLDGRFGFVAGLYAFEEDATFTEALSLTPAACVGFAPPPVRPVCLNNALANATDLSVTQNSQSMAVYAQGDYAVTDTLSLQLGARYTSDERDGRFLQLAANPFAAIAFRAPEDTALEFSDETPTFRVGLNYTPTVNLLAFASYSTGYKSGGFNSGGGTAPLGAAQRTFDSEEAENYEIGLKGVAFDDRLDFSVTLYRTELEDFQARSFDGTSFLTRNAGSLVHQGVEAEGVFRISDNVVLTGGVAYLDSEFSDFRGAQALPGCSAASPDIAGCGPVGADRSVQDLTGGRAHFAPEWTGNLFADVTGSAGAWDWHLNAGVNFIGEQYVGGAIDNNPQVLEDGYALASARLTFRSPNDRFALAIFGENLTDEGYCALRFYQPLGGAFGVTDAATGGTLVRCNTGAPRSVGARISARF